MIEKGKLPDVGSSNVAYTEIIKVEKDTFYFKTTLSDTGFILEDEFVKISDEISDEFNSIIKKIEEN